MTLEEVLNSIDLEKAKAPMPETWAQGRTLFGGLITSMLFHYLKTKVSPGQHIRSMSVSFVGPSSEGDLEFSAIKLREGKNVSQWRGEVINQGQVVLSVIASFGFDRESQLSLPSLPAPEIKAPDQIDTMPYIKGVAPEAFQHFNLKIAKGDFPYSNSQKNYLGGWMKSADQNTPLREEELIAYCDAWPPTMLQNMKSFAPASSLTWTIEFVHPMPTHTTQDWLQYDANTEHLANGYGHFAANIWDHEGNLLVLSRQTAAVFC